MCLVLREKILVELIQKLVDLCISSQLQAYIFQRVKSSHTVKHGTIPRVYGAYPRILAGLPYTLSSTKSDIRWEYPGFSALATFIWTLWRIQPLHLFNKCLFVETLQVRRHATTGKVVLVMYGSKQGRQCCRTRIYLAASLEILTQMLCFVYSVLSLVLVPRPLFLYRWEVLW